MKFNHAPHIRANVECSTCHGDIAHQTVAQRNVNLDMGDCVTLSPGEEGAERLSHVSLLMDRRSFIKLTAITGTSATLASCGSPENQLIRFVPDEELVPGVAEWKPSVCPLCASGCGVNVRVMEADVETARDGQQGVVRMGVAKKLEGNAAHPGQPGRPVRARPGGDSGHLSPRSHHAAAEAQRRARRRRLRDDHLGPGDRGARLQARRARSGGTQKSLAFVTGGHRSHRQVLIDRGPGEVRRARRPSRSSCLATTCCAGRMR